MSGELDRGEVGSELVNIFYNIISDLAKHGYVLAIHEKPKKSYSPPPTSPPHSPPTSHLTHRKPHQEGSAVRSTMRSNGRLTANHGGEEVDGE